MYPLGYVKRVIKAGEGLGDSQRVINLLHQIPTRPNQECISAADGLRNFVYDGASDAAAAGLEDIRRQLTISIDPPGCQDVDDTLTLCQLPNGGFLVGIHIADVGNFVAKGDVIDSDAGRRMMSFYAATDKVYHMLPARLSEKVCTLLQDMDRCALSVYLETDPALKVIDTRSRSPVCRSLIRNDRQMTYEEAQQIIDEEAYKELSPLKDGSVNQTIVYLHRIAQRLRIDRLRQARHCFSEPDDPFCLLECHEAHQLVEEFMIRTNSAVAQFLASRFPDSFPVRRQKSPDDDEVSRWSGRHEAVLQVSMYFQQFDMLNSLLRREHVQDDESVKPTRISFLQSTIAGLKTAVENRDLRKAVSMIAYESQHPLHLLAMSSWFQIQVSQSDSKLLICSYKLTVSLSQTSISCYFTGSFFSAVEVWIAPFLCWFLSDNPDALSVCLPYWYELFLYTDLNKT